VVQEGRRQSIYFEIGTLPEAGAQVAALFTAVPIMAVASEILKQRVRRPSYLKKLCLAEDLIDLFPNGTYIGWSGFTGVGYPSSLSRNYA
jgi:hypothetical protein